MTDADVAGLVGSLFLLVAPARDQTIRWRIWARQRRPRDALREFEDKANAFQERRRNSPALADSFTFAIGAVLLGLSYVL